jgi:hypothetical protein
MKHTRVLVASAFCLVSAAEAGAASLRYQCVLSHQSQLTQTTDVALPLAGTFIGNYDATTNPTGTRTLPGLFGGSGNQAIPYTSTVRSGIHVADTVPSGAFELSLDPSTGAVAVSGLVLDALSGQNGTIATSLVISFGNFHTVAPSAVYLGVSNLSLPLDSGQLTRADATQTGAAVGMATPDGAGGWTFALAVPVDLMVEGFAFGQPFGGDPVPGAIALAGTITPGKGGVRVEMDATASGEQAVPSLGELPATPFDLPTYLPPGGTAHILLSGTFGDGTLTSAIDAHLDALGTPVIVPGDLNGDGAVNGADLGQLLAAWGTPGGDLDGDGTTSGVDLGILLANWSA